MWRLVTVTISTYLVGSLLTSLRRGRVFRNGGERGSSIVRTGLPRIGDSTHSIQALVVRKANEEFGARNGPASGWCQAS
jgi:hypothetical protein